MTLHPVTINLPEADYRRVQRAAERSQRSVEQLPNEQVWKEHFCWGENGTVVVGKTPIGRATVASLDMNHPDIVAARQLWVMVGWHPPQDDEHESS